MNAMWLLLTILLGAYDVTAVSITANPPAQPQTSAPSMSITEAAIAPSTSNAFVPTTVLFSNATNLAPASASGCSANCTFTLLSEVTGRWKRCIERDGVHFAGQVKYIVDRLKNATMTTTIYAGKITFYYNGTENTAEASDIMSNSAFEYSRTDVNDAGTVTASIYNRIIGVAYPTVKRHIGNQYSWTGILPYATENTTECVTATDGPYSLPTNVVLPTSQVGQLDSGDPRGLSYCYDSGHPLPLEDDLIWSRFNGTIIEALHNVSNCEQYHIGVAPVSVAGRAVFLLETTTDFVDEPTPSPSTKTNPTPTDVLVDPFQRSSQSEDEQESSRSKGDIKPSPAPASPTVAEPAETKSAPDRATPATKQSLEAPVSPADQSSRPSDHDNESGSSESRVTKPTAPADDVSASRVAQSTAPANEISNSGDRPTASLTISQLGVLNSLIQAVGQQQSTVDHAAPASNDVPTLTLDGVTATPDSSSDYVLGEQTLRAGGPAITIPGTQSSLASGASAIVVGSITSILVVSESPEDFEQAAWLAPTLTLTANSDSTFKYVVGDLTIKPGEPAITVSGTPISLDSQATVIVVGSSTRPVVTVPNGGDRSHQAEAQSAGKLASRLALAGATATLNSDSEYVVADQTLKPGGPAITISGTQISLAPQATAVIIGSSTSMLTTAPQYGDRTQQVGKLASVLTLAGATATLNSASQYVIGDQTLTPGENAITVSGTRVSLAPHATAAVIGSSTSALASSSPGIGDYVWAGIAGALAVAEASSTGSGSEVVVASTASDGKVVVETIFTAEPTKSSPTGSSSSSSGASPLAYDETSSMSSSTSSTDSPSSPTGTSSLASGETSSTSSSSSIETSDVASAAGLTKSAVNVAALICWTGLLMMFGS